MKFEKGKKQIVFFLAGYLTVSVIVFLSSMSSFSFSVTWETELKFYSLFSIIAATLVFIYTKNMFKHASSFEKTAVLHNDQERLEAVRKEQDSQNREEKKKKAEAEQKLITEKIGEISAALDENEDNGAFFDQLLIGLSKNFDIVQGVAYVLNNESKKFAIAGTYAYYTEQTDRTFEIGEGIPGQVAKDKKFLELDNVPENYIQVVSGLGSSSPKHLIVIPVVYKDETIAILELAAFSAPQINGKAFYEQFNAKIAEKVYDNLKTAGK